MLAFTNQVAISSFRQIEPPNDEKDHRLPCFLLEMTVVSDRDLDRNNVGKRVTCSAAEYYLSKGHRGTGQSKPQLRASKPTLDPEGGLACWRRSLVHGPRWPHGCSQHDPRRISERMAMEIRRPSDPLHLRSFTTS